MRKSVGRQKTNALLSGEKTDNVKGVKRKRGCRKKERQFAKRVSGKRRCSMFFRFFGCFFSWLVCACLAARSAATCILTSTRLTLNRLVLSFFREDF